MVNTGSSDWETVMKIGQQVKKEVNKKYKLLEIEIDGVYQMMLLLKKKKYALVHCSHFRFVRHTHSHTLCCLGRYAALLATQNKDGSLDVKKEMKGLDLVRRDWCPLSKETGVKVLDYILSGLPADQVVDKIHAFLEEVARSIRAGKVPLAKFVITKGLNKVRKHRP